MHLFANRVSPVFFQSPSCRIYFAEKNGWSFRISNAEPFYPISKEKKTTNPGDKQINFGTAVPAISDGFQTVEQFDCMRLWGGYAPILFIQLEQLNINHY